VRLGSYGHPKQTKTDRSPTDGSGQYVTDGLRRGAHHFFGYQSLPRFSIQIRTGSRVDHSDPVCDLTRGEKYVVEAAIERAKRVHLNMRQEISLSESRLKQRNEDGMVYFRWNGFYYRIQYENGEKVLAS